MLVAAVLSAPAAAADGPPPDAPWWLGLPLADVQLEAAGGALPDANLEPLLRARELEPVDPQTVRLDLETLFRVGEFSGVEADLEPWTVLDEDGEPRDAALLTYVLYPAPKVDRVRVLGNHEFSDRELLDALDIAKGSVFYPDIDDDLRGRARRGLAVPARAGRRRRSQIRTTEPEPGRLHVVADVDEGEPNTLLRLVFAGEIEGVVTDRELRRWARREGVAEGRPLAPDAVGQVQDAIRTRLGERPRRAVRAARGCIGARVTPAVVEDADGVRVTYAIEPGPRLELVVNGHRRQRTRARSRRRSGSTTGCA